MAYRAIIWILSGSISGAVAGALWETYRVIDLEFVRACIFGAIVWAVVTAIVWLVSRSIVTAIPPMYGALILAMGSIGLGLIVGNAAAIWETAEIGALVGTLGGVVGFWARDQALRVPRVEGPSSNRPIGLIDPDHHPET